MAGEQPAQGSDAPSFNLQDQNGEWHTLEDYRGQWLAIYFYPKDDTPGCTTEACNFRDNIYAFKAIDAAVVGISVDDVESHKKFSDKYKLPFTLLADSDSTDRQCLWCFEGLQTGETGQPPVIPGRSRTVKLPSTTQMWIRIPTPKKYWRI